MNSKPISNKHYDTIIVGAGPGGLQLGYYLQQRRESYLILEAGDKAGHFFASFPRHRTLISINKVHTGFDDTGVNLRWDWNSLLSDDDAMLFREFSTRYFPSADDMVEYLGAFSRRFGLNVRTSSSVVEVSKDEVFRVELEDGTEMTCEVMVVATGRAKAFVPDIPGIELAECYTAVSIDPAEFTNQRVFIIGKGNSAFETADNLVETASVIHLASPTNIQMAWKTHYVGHLRAVNNNILDTYQLKAQNTIIDGTIERISRENGRFIVNVRYSHAEGQRIEVPVDRVLACAGFRFDDEIFDESARPELALDGRFPAMTSEWESTNVKGMYFAGALMHARDFKKTFSGFIHGFRYNIAVLDQFLMRKYKGVSQRHRTLPFNPEALFQEIYYRVHTNSSLFQQPGFLCDLVVFPADSGEDRFLYYQDLPVDYLEEHDVPQRRPYLLLTMEYGKDEHADPFNIQRRPEDGGSSAFIHPVLRFKDPEGTKEYNIPEDLENNWYQSLYMRPFYEFLCRIMKVPHRAPEWGGIKEPFDALRETTVCK